MLKTPKVEIQSYGNVRVSWTGTAGVESRIVVNGETAYTGTLDETEKSVTLSVPNPCVIEVHEGDDFDRPISSTIDRKPLAWWTSRSSAEYYKVYATPADDGERMVATVAHEATRQQHEYQATEDLRQDDTAWATFRIEAVNSHGVESSGTTKPVFAPGIPDEPSAVGVSGSGGTFDIEVTS
jgi:hypothetical protein